MGTGVRVLGLLGGESGTGMYRGAQPCTRLLGRRTLRPQAARRVHGHWSVPSGLPAKTSYKVDQLINPLPVARAPGVKGHGCANKLSFSLVPRPPHTAFVACITKSVLAVLQAVRGDLGTRLLSLACATASHNQGCNGYQEWG